MKKFMMVIALLTLSALVSSSFADVQNIRLSGDVRIRGYYNTYGGELPQTSLIAQRTRITCEADLEDHVLVVVTLKAEGQWGDWDVNSNGNETGAGYPTWGSPINRGWGVEINEAYVQLNEMFFQAATLKLGRQYLHYGRGMIISSVENEYNFDAARLVLDYYPLTVDLVAALLNNQDTGFFPIGSFGPSDRNYLLFVNARYEMTDSFIKAIEGYAGYVTQSKDNYSVRANTGYAPMIMGASPWIIGLRGDLNLTKNLQAWVEGAYEGGNDGFASGSAGKTISAFLVNAGAQLSLGDTKMSPVLHANYTFASGGGSYGQNNFRPWFDYAADYNGFIAKPLLSNVHIFNVGASIKPAKNCTAGVDVYYYMKSAKNMYVEQNPNIDLGYGRMPLGAEGAGDIGWEVDAKLGYDYSKDVRFGLIAGVFIPGKSIKNDFIDETAIGIRGEVAVKF